MTRIITLFIIFVLNGTGFSQSFEGKINFVKKTRTDTIYYSYLVKDKIMRVDEMTESEYVLQSLLLDLENNTMTAISPARKMYMPFPVNPYVPKDSLNFEIVKTENMEKIVGYSCQKNTVKNNKDSVLVDYWIAKDGFDFFIDFLKLSNTADKSASYYLQLRNIEGCFPMLSIEKDFSGEEVLRLEVTEILPEELNPELFKIPSDYVSFQR